jgi:uncharacterized damage-inducible protein DinB
MKEVLIQYASYNVWANAKLGDVVVSLNEEQQEQPVISSFPSIKLTLLHMWDAGNIWWQRMKLVENIIWPSTLSEYSTREIVGNLLQQDRQWLEWITDATPAAIDHVFSYQNTKREQFKQPVFKCLCMFLTMALITGGK